MKIIACLLCLMLFSPASGAIEAVEDISELTLLPTYCRGTQQIRTISNDPKPFEEYVAIYGEAYHHLHHYCYALNSENKLPKIHDERYKQSELISILANIQYVLDRAPLTFSLIPDIYLSKARVLFKMERDVEAVGVLFKLTRIRPDYGPAYAQLGDYYQRIGDKHSALKFFEQGLINGVQANAEFFIRKIKKIDKTYKIPPIKSPPKAAEADTPAPAIAPASAPEASNQEKPNPYCRFCP